MECSDEDYNSYNLGELVHVLGVFTLKSSGDLVDPSVVKLSILNPNGVLTTYTYLSGVVIVRESEGNYYSDINANIPGTWYYRWWSTGVGQAADEHQFLVMESMAVEAAA